MYAAQEALYMELSIDQFLALVVVGVHAPRVLLLYPNVSLFPRRKTKIYIQKRTRRRNNEPVCVCLV
jgi:hypothetical protein